MTSGQNSPGPLEASDLATAEAVDKPGAGGAVDERAEAESSVSIEAEVEVTAGRASGAAGKSQTELEREALWPTYWAIGVALAAIAATATMIVSDRAGVAMDGTFMLALAFLTCLAAALCDSATRRIPNVLTYPALLIALAINLAIVPLVGALSPAAEAWFGAPMIDEALLGFVGCAAIGVISFMFRGLGGGDVKLIAAIGAMLGFPEVGGVLFNALVFASVIGLANLAFKGHLVRRVQAMSMAFQVNLALRKKAVDAYPFGKTEAPFGVALLLGLISAQWLPFYVPLLNWLAPGIGPTGG